MDCNFATLLTMKKSWPKMTARSFTLTVAGMPEAGLLFTLVRPPEDGH